MKELLKKLLKKEIRITFESGEKKDNLIIEEVQGNTLIVSSDGNIKLINIDTISYVTVEGLDMLEQFRDNQKEGGKNTVDAGSEATKNEAIKEEEIEKIKSTIGKYSRRNKK